MHTLTSRAGGREPPPADSPCPAIYTLPRQYSVYGVPPSNGPTERGPRKHSAAAAVGRQGTAYPEGLDAGAETQRLAGRQAGPTTKIARVGPAAGGHKSSQSPTHRRALAHLGYTIRRRALARLGFITASAGPLAVSERRPTWDVKYLGERRPTWDRYTIPRRAMAHLGYTKPRRALAHLGLAQPTSCRAQRSHCGCKWP